MVGVLKKEKPRPAYTLNKKRGEEIDRPRYGKYALTSAATTKTTRYKRVSGDLIDGILRRGKKTLVPHKVVVVFYICIDGWANNGRVLVIVKDGDRMICFGWARPLLLLLLLPRTAQYTVDCMGGKHAKCFSILSLSARLPPLQER